MNNCPYFKACGACSYPLDNYEASLKDKVARLESKFKIKEVKANPLVYNYRHKIIYRFFKMKGEIKAGFYEEGSGSLVAIKECMIQHSYASEVIKVFLKLANKYHMQVYNPKTKSGFLRYLVMRVAKSGKVSLCLVVGDNLFPGSRNFLSQLRKECKDIVNFDLLLNRRDTSIVMEGPLKTLYGKGYIQDELDDLKFLISSKAFYQVNPYMAEIIYRDVINYLKPSKDEVVLDAYCGIGTISLYLVKQAKSVLAVDINAESIKDAKANAKINNIENVDFLAHDVKDLAYREAFDLLVVDPPRSGMDDAFIKMIIAKKPKRMAYVSCNPETLERDLKKLGKYYDFEDITLYDQFGFTKHLEALTVGKLKNVNIKYKN